MSTLKRIAFIVLITLVSVPFAAWFWFSLLDIGQIPFSSDYWEVESVVEITTPGGSKTQGVAILSKHIFAQSITCTMITRFNEPTDEVVATSSYHVDTPRWWPSFITNKVLTGCAHFSNEETERLADEHEKTLKEGDDGKV